MYGIICSRFDEKGNSKLENFCKDIDKCNTKNTKIEPDNWFTDLIHLHRRVYKSSSDFNNTGK